MDSDDDSSIRKSRRINAEKAINRGYVYFQFFGPKDPATRPLCRILVNRIWHVETIAEIDTGHEDTPHLLIDGGGPGCRHHWRPVRREWFDDSEWWALRGDEEVLAQSGFIKRPQTKGLQSTHKSEVPQPVDYIEYDDWGKDQFRTMTPKRWVQIAIGMVMFAGFIWIFVGDDGSSGVDQPQPQDQTPTKTASDDRQEKGSDVVDRPENGDIGYIAVDPEWPKQWIVPVVLEKGDFQELNRYLSNTDWTGVEEMAQAGKVVRVEKNTEARVIDSTMTMINLRVTQGDYAGVEGWVPFEWIYANPQ